MDTSPFYSGGTHLAWCAADGLIIPVRVDEHSIDSLELTLDLLSNPERDFVIWNERAGGRRAPRVAAIAMTMVGSKSQMRATPDRASRMYIERALGVAEKYAALFDHDEPADAFVITDDFVSAGELAVRRASPYHSSRSGDSTRLRGGAYRSIHRLSGTSVNWRTWQASSSPSGFGGPPCDLRSSPSREFLGSGLATLDPT